MNVIYSRFFHIHFIRAKRRFPTKGGIEFNFARVRLRKIDQSQRILRRKKTREQIRRVKKLKCYVSIWFFVNLSHRVHKIVHTRVYLWIENHTIDNRLLLESQNYFYICKWATKTTTSFYLSRKLPVELGARDFLSSTEAKHKLFTRSRRSSGPKLQ